MRTYKIHLIRHGLTDANTEGRYVGLKSDLPLCPQSVKELKTLKENNDYPQIDALYTSPLLRCKQTASLLFPGFEPKVIDELAEYDFGEFEGKTASQLEVNESYLEWTSGKIPAPPGGETSTDFIKRQALGLNRIVRDMMDNGIFESAAIMHGGAIMMLLANCAVPRKRSVEWTSEPGRGYSILITPSLYHSSGIIEVFDII
ncbi:MAG: histidine phosphatase family protein [Clostridia bacterium]|nr:histidine phosphatase family protein [Clostridia bacterium]